jgi:hypothetical protein
VTVQCERTFEAGVGADLVAEPALLRACIIGLALAVDSDYLGAERVG